MSILDTLKKRLTPSLLERAREYVQAGHVRAVRRGTDEEVYVLTLPGRTDAIEVTLWPKDNDWACSCEAPACAHVAAACLLPATAATPTLKEDYRVRYHLQRRDRELVLSRTEPARAVRDSADQELNRLFASRWGRMGTPPKMWEQACALLAAVPVDLDGKPIKVSGQPVLPRILVEDHPPGWKVRMVRAAGIEEFFPNSGVVRMGDTLRPVGEAPLDELQRQQLMAGKIFGPSDARVLVTRFLPDLQKLLSVEVLTQRLPNVGSEPPRMHLEIHTDGDRLALTPTLVYGDPVYARVERGQLRLTGSKLPTRDAEAERRITEELAGLGLGFDLKREWEGPDAVRFIEGLPTPLRQRILSQAPHFQVVGEAITPRMHLRETPGGYRLDVEAGGASPEALVTAWERGWSMVKLTDGWRPLPRDWMEKHGAILAELLSVRDKNGTLTAAATPMLLQATQALDSPPPASLQALRALAGDFTALPHVQLPPTFVATLRPYQQLGVDWLCWLRTVNMGGVLADDMGLGKTVQCIGALATQPGPHLVVAPTSVLRNWENEVHRFWPGATLCFYHGADRSLDVRADVVLTSYALLRLDQERLSAVRWSTMVLDEAQMVKNPTSQVALAAGAMNAAQKLALSGTPVENRLEELWSVLHLVCPGLLGGRTAFQTRFATPIANGHSRAQQELRRRIRPFMLRRLKQEVAPELPPRTDMVLRCTLSAEERLVYDAAANMGRAEVAKLLDGGKMIQVLEVLLRMRQAACHPGLVRPGAAGSAKLELLYEQLEEVVAEGHKALVFSQWTSLLDQVEPGLQARNLGFTRLDGTTRDRGAVVSQFMAPDGPPVFLLSLKAGGTGLNLTAADHVFLLDPWWNPAVEDQATDRAHRIGQQNPVFAYRLIAENTVEERILKLQEQKRELARAAMDEEALARSLTREELLSLFE